VGGKLQQIGDDEKDFVCLDKPQRFFSNL
jgi:hypothetical protein